MLRASSLGPPLQGLASRTAGFSHSVPHAVIRLTEEVVTDGEHGNVALGWQQAASLLDLLERALVEPAAAVKIDVDSLKLDLGVLQRDPDALRERACRVRVQGDLGGR